MFKLLKNLKKNQIILVLFVVLLVICQVWLELKMPDYMSQITQLVQTKGSQMNEILKNGIYMLACALGSLVAAIFTGYLTSSISSKFTATIREKLFKKVEDLPMQEIKRFSTSSLITRTTNDVTHIQMLIAMGLQLTLKAPITAIWAVTKILNKSWQWSTVTGMAVVLLLSVVGALMSIVVPKFKIVQKLTDKLNGVTRSNLLGIRVVRAFNAEKFEEDKFEKVNTDLTNLQLFNQKTFAIMQPIMYLVIYGLTLAIYYIGVQLIDGANLENKILIFGDMVVFSSYAMQVLMSFLMLALIFMMYPRAEVSAKRINEVLDAENNLKDGEINQSLANKKGTIEFKDVSFKYADSEEYVLKNITFSVNQGETAAFIGSTGSGKSTLINLIPRFYDPTEGEILVDGVNIKKYSQEFLNNKLGYVPQKAVIFNGTVNYNVSYGSGDKQDEAKIKEAINIAQAKEFVEKMDKKYETEIAQGGTNISGGQKQRLAIARAIARNPEIYIFDDSFSALDYKTDSILRKELKKYTKDATVLIVAQRIGTVMNADKIVVLENGKIAGIGKHKDLIKNCEVYKQIALSQLSKEELENG